MALLSEFFGGKPRIPDYDPVNAREVQQRNLSGNTAALPETIAQTSGLNFAQFAEVDKMLAQASGGVYARLRDRALANTEDLLKGGDITDVLAGTAASNLARGVAGSGFGFSTAIKNSADRVQANKMAGFDSLQRWLSVANSAYQPVNVASMFARNTYDANTALSHAVNERDAQFQHDFVKNQWDWYGSFGQQFVRMENSLMGTAGTVAGAYFGSQGGSGGGGSTGGGGGPQSSGGGGGGL